MLILGRFKISSILIISTKSIPGLAKWELFLSCGIKKLSCCKFVYFKQTEFSRYLTFKNRVLVVVTFYFLYFKRLDNIWMHTDIINEHIIEYYVIYIGVYYIIFYYMGVSGRGSAEQKY